ncbi:MAG: N-acetyltransferase [Promethearchaeota archaeon]|nr:MAG: N-acetyltransferase [Candidatus Lokiarchaeota archaeon]
MKKAEIIEEINQDNFFLRKISLKDADFIHESLKGSNLTKFLSLGPISSRDHAKKLIKNYLDYWTDKIQFNYIIEIRDSDDKPKMAKKIGLISIWRISWQHKRAEIGIWVNTKYWNQGFAQKALSLIKIVCFNHLKLNRIEAHIAAENTKSIYIFKKSGFKEEGVLRKYLYLNGKFHDAVILSYINNFK